MKRRGPLNHYPTISTRALTLELDIRAPCSGPELADEPIFQVHRCRYPPRRVFTSCWLSIIFILFSISFGDQEPDPDRRIQSNGKNFKGEDRGFDVLVAKA